jgi:hypothetical protein
VPKFIYPARTTTGTCQLTEITQGIYKTFTKMILNNDGHCLNIFVNKLINELADDNSLPSNLNIIDKLVLLLDARCYSISPIIDLAKEVEKKKLNYQLDINKVISSILQLEYDKEFTYTTKAINCKATLPRQLIYNEPGDIFSDSLSYLQLNGESVSLDYSFEDKKKLVDKLPPILLTEYLKFIGQVEDKIKTIDVVSLPEDISEEKYPISVFGNNIVQLLSLFFYLDLATTHQNEYQLVRNFNFTVEQINNTPPAEITLYYNYIAAEAEEAKKEQQKASQSTDGVTFPGGLSH